MDLRKTRWQDWVNPLKWWSVIQSMFYKRFLSQSVIEQYMMRFIRCSDCVLLEYCKYCGCHTESKMLVPNEMDSTDPNNIEDLPRWGPIMPDDEWKEIKKKNNIYFSMHINGEETVQLTRLTKNNKDGQ